MGILQFDQIMNDIANSTQEMPGSAGWRGVVGSGQRSCEQNCQTKYVRFVPHVLHQNTNLCGIAGMT